MGIHGATGSEDAKIWGDSSKVGVEKGSLLGRAVRLIGTEDAGSALYHIKEELEPIVDHFVAHGALTDQEAVEMKGHLGSTELGASVRQMSEHIQGMIHLISSNVHGQEMQAYEKTGSWDTARHDALLPGLNTLKFLEEKLNQRLQDGAGGKASPTMAGHDRDAAKRTTSARVDNRIMQPTDITTGEAKVQFRGMNPDPRACAAIVHSIAQGIDTAIGNIKMDALVPPVERANQLRDLSSKLTLRTLHSTASGIFQKPLDKNEVLEMFQNIEGQIRRIKSTSRDPGTLAELGKLDKALREIRADLGISN